MKVKEVWRDEKYLKLEKFLGQDPIEFCEKHITPEYSAALKLEIPPNDVADKMGILLRADGRDIQKFYRELAIGRIIDLYDIMTFEERGLRLNAFDKENKLVIRMRPNHYPDLIDNSGCLVEVIHDFANCVDKYGFIHFRKNKLPYLAKLSASENVSVLINDIQKCMYAELPIVPNMASRYKCEKVDRIWQFGGNEGWRLHIDKEMFNYYPVRKGA